MTQAQLVMELTNDAVIASFAASVLFVATYTALARWWRSEVGRALVALDTGLALTLAPLVLHRLSGLNVSSLGFAWYYFGSLTLVAGATLWRTVIVVRTQWRDRVRQAGAAPRMPPGEAVSGDAPR